MYTGNILMNLLIQGLTKGCLNLVWPW